MTAQTERKIEIVGPFKHIQVKDTVHIYEDGVKVASKAPHRFVVGLTTATDDPELQALKVLYHTQELIDAYLANG